jgi:hypothetical protein
VFCGLFALLPAASAPTGAAKPASTAPTPIRAASAVEIRAWQPSPFVEVLLDDPDLAGCWFLASRWWGLTSPVSSLPDGQEVGDLLAGSLKGVLSLPVGSTLTVVAVAADTKLPGAVAHGGTVLLLLPAATPFSPDAVARSISEALLSAQTAPAPPDARCSEPLVAVGEALAWAGSRALASLPPELRPVRDWAEKRDVEEALKKFLDAALDGETPWQTRRALITSVARPGGASPQLAHAAALLVEASGDGDRDRLHPLDLLLAWREGTKDAYPLIPRSLRKALSRPLEAGMPERRDATKGDSEAIARDGVARAIMSGHAPARPDPLASLSLRMRAVADLRARGDPSACAWLEGVELPPKLRTGCRAEGEAGGFVYARPTPDAGAEIVARSLAGEEGVLLHWPRWALFPVVTGEKPQLLFIDQEGIWALSLAPDGAPHLLLAGSYRRLVPSPDGHTIATTRWPDGRLVLLRGDGSEATDIGARGGMAWLQPDVLMASDGDRLVATSTEGRSRPWPTPLPCTHSLAARDDTLLAGLARPCEPTLVRMTLADGKTSPVLALADGPAGIAVLPDSTFILNAGTDLWLWSGGETAERIGAGLTPGPG